MGWGKGVEGMGWCMDTECKMVNMSAVSVSDWACVQGQGALGKLLLGSCLSPDSPESLSSLRTSCLHKSCSRESEAMVFNTSNSNPALFPWPQRGGGHGQNKEAQRLARNLQVLGMWMQASNLQASNTLSPELASSSLQPVGLVVARPRRQIRGMDIDS